MTKKPSIYLHYFPILLLLLFTLSACSSEYVYAEEQLAEIMSEAKEDAYNRGYEDAREEIYPEAYAEGEANGYERGYDAGYDTAYEDYNSFDIERYYEGLCRKYGYLTYDSVYSPHLQRYVDPTSYKFHIDWLCPDLDNSSCIEINDSELSSEYILCDLCNYSSNMCYLDISSSIFHSSPSHLNLGTEDYIHTLTSCKFVSYDNAISKGYTACLACFG